MKNDAKPMDGMTRSAVLMMSLGEDAAAEVFKYLSAREVQQVGAAMASLKQVTRNDVAVVLEEFRQEADQFMAVTLGSDDYIRTVLTKALGSDRAAGLIEDILEAGEGGSGIDALNWLDPHTVAELIGDEHPQIIATILVHLERDRAAGVLALLTDRLFRDPAAVGHSMSLLIGVATLACIGLLAAGCGKYRRSLAREEGERAAETVTAAAVPGRRPRGRPAPLS